MPTAPPVIPVVPTPVPSTDNPGNFDANADALLGWFPGGVEAIQEVADVTKQNADEVFEAVATISAAALVASNAAGLAGRSNSPLTVGAGTKNVTLLAARPDLVELNRRVVLVNRADPSIKMWATIASVTSSTQFTATVVSSGAFGSGSYSTWHVIDGAFFGSAATKEAIFEGSDDTAGVTAKGLTDAMKPVQVPYAGTVTLNMKAGISFTIDPLTGNLVLANPTGLADKIGQTGSVTIPQDGTGGRLISYGTYWKARLGPEALSTPANSWDTLYYEIKSATRIEYSMGRGFAA